MTDYRAIWEGLDRKQQDILCKAGLHYEFKVRCSYVAVDEKSYRDLAHKGLLKEYNHGDNIVTYILTDLGADVLSNLPNNLRYDWWPLPQDITAMKKALEDRGRDF